ncbi:MAG: hypothetical protein HQ556_07590 [Candidatus Marinimicrobia bacterium]|nr:hypothetical protein [Candidatus Neomarinimicrobiota bacterium]
MNRRLNNIQHLIVISIALMTMSMQSLSGQTINFSVHVASALDATKDADMAFPQVMAGDGITTIGLGDGGMGIFAISGNEELDVEVTLVAPTDLVHVTYPAQKMPLNLQLAYANHGVNDINQAKTATGNIARFQMKERESGPAGAPPTPPSSAHTPQIVTAYLYVYGTINVGMISSGAYSGTVDLYVQYY